MAYQISYDYKEIKVNKIRKMVQEAAGELVESIRKGEKIENAVNVFCQELAG